MISKNDLILLLTELEEEGVDIGDNIGRVFKSPSLPLDVIKFINSHRQLDLTAFYENIRKNYNKKKSKIYISIVKEVEDPESVLTTLSAYMLQAILYSKKAQDGEMFLRHARVKEVGAVLSQYFTTYDLTLCLKLLRLIKADLVACELIENRRDNT